MSQNSSSQSSFFALISRMRYIERWSLMRNSRSESLAEHALDVAVISHCLATIANVRYHRNLDADRAALIGIYHDASEIITGDMPTPVKYANSEIRDAYHQVEARARKPFSPHCQKTCKMPMLRCLLTALRLQRVKLILESLLKLQIRLQHSLSVLRRLSLETQNLLPLKPQLVELLKI